MSPTSTDVTTKDRIIELLRSANREGMESMIDYLIEEGFFESPASTRFHGAYPGGLADHSLRVFQLLEGYSNELDLATATGSGQEPLPLEHNNLIIAALLHDACKICAYIPTPEGKSPYKWNRNQPKGHAVLSLEIIQRYIKLTELEELMIKYHMGIYGLNEFYKENDWQQGEYPLRGDDSKSKEERRGKSMANAWFHNPIIKLMYFCDELATMQEKADTGEHHETKEPENK